MAARYAAISLSTLSLSPDTDKGDQIALEKVKSQYDCWELNSGPLEEQPLFLTAELSL